MTRWVVLFLFALTACNRQPAARVEAAKPPEGAEQPKRLVLDGNQQKQAGVVLEAVRISSISAAITASGRLVRNENRTFRVGAITEGLLIRVLANVGDRVEKGQLLAGMHTHEIHESRAEYRKALSEVSRLKSAAAYALKQRDRARRLYELKAASLEQVEHAESEFRNAEAALENAGTDVRRTRQHLVEYLQVDPEGHIEHSEGESEQEGNLVPVRAPASGVVLERNVTAGSVAAPGAELFVISDLSSLWLIAAVAEEHLGKLRTGISVRASVAAYPNRFFTGTITRIGDRLDPETRTVQVRVDLDNSAGLLRPEMYAIAEIAGAPGPAGLFVPTAAIQQLEGKPVLFVETTANHFEPRPVRSGRTMDGRIEIVEGLRAGERIVTQGSYMLKSQLLKASMTKE
jgi:cobalt-zinc-cadmium efflux system membrane fusion protein